MTYRLFHEALIEHLRVTPPPGDTQWRIVSALLVSIPEAGERKDWEHSSAYTRKYLATHAVAAGRLDEIIEDPGYLLAADIQRLLAALPSVSDQKAILNARAFRIAAHNLRNKTLNQRAAHLQLAARQSGAEDLANAIDELPLKLPWRTAWVHSRDASDHYIVGRHAAPVYTVAVGELEGAFRDRLWRRRRDGALVGA